MEVKEGQDAKEEYIAEKATRGVSEDDGEDDSEGEEFIPLGNGRGNERGSKGNPPWYRAESIVERSPHATLHNEILDLCDLLSPTPEEKDRAAAAISYVKEVVNATLGGNAKVHVFGSHLTGLVLPSSDVDTVVMGAPPNAIRRLGNAMQARRNNNEVREVSVIASARVPIVKFVHTATSIQVDVSFDMTSGLESGAAAKELMSNMQQVRPLVMVLKAYMGQRQLNETYKGGIGSFLLQLMTVGIVQKCTRDVRSEGSPPTCNLGYLLDEFFDFYGNQLNYTTTGVTLLGSGGGGFYNKQDCGWSSQARLDLLSFQNPFNPSIDVGSNSYKVDACRRSFKATSARLKCAIQKAIAAHKMGGEGEGSKSLLRFVLDPTGPLAKRSLPPPTFCTRIFYQGKDDDGDHKDYDDGKDKDYDDGKDKDYDDGNDKDYDDGKDKGKDKISRGKIRSEKRKASGSFVKGSKRWRKRK